MFLGCFLLGSYLEQLLTGTMLAMKFPSIQMNHAVLKRIYHLDKHLINRNWFGWTKTCFKSSKITRRHSHARRLAVHCRTLNMPLKRSLINKSCVNYESSESDICLTRPWSEIYYTVELDKNSVQCLYQHSFWTPLHATFFLCRMEFFFFFSFLQFNEIFPFCPLILLVGCCSLYGSWQAKTK